MITSLQGEVKMQGNGRRIEVKVLKRTARVHGTDLLLLFFCFSGCAVNDANPCFQSVLAPLVSDW